MAGKNARFSTSSDSSNLSASATVVNPSSAENSPQIPQGTPSNDGATADSSSSDDEDIEEPEEPKFPDDPLQGWPQLALLMAKTPDFAAFSRFRELNTKSLLYYQAELTLYREKLHKLEYQDALKGENWAQRADKLVETNSEQFRTVKEMRKLLKEYNEALLQYSKICALPGPEPYNMRTLRQWLRNERGADGQVRSAHNLQNTWGDLRKDLTQDEGSLWKQFGQVLLGLIWTPNVPNDDLDIAATKPKVKIDGFTRWVVCDLVRFWKTFRMQRDLERIRKQEEADIERRAAQPTGSHLDKYQEKRRSKRRNKKEIKRQVGNWIDRVEKRETLESWGEKRALRVTSGISTLVACLLPVVAISVLSQLHGLRDLLLCLAGFAIIFALGLIFLTQGTSSRTEIFAATAAFSAVMVVFISIPPAPVIVVPPGTPTPLVSPSPIPAL